MSMPLKKVASDASLVDASCAGHDLITLSNFILRVVGNVGPAEALVRCHEPERASDPRSFGVGKTKLADCETPHRENLAV